MNNKIVNLLVFAVGAVIGSAVTWKLVKDKYAQIAQEEIDSVKEVYSRREISKAINEGLNDGLNAEPNEKVVNSIKQHFNNEKPSLAEYAKKLSKEGYINCSEISSFSDSIESLGKMSTIIENQEEGEEEADKPYIIPPESFGELDYYDCVSLNYFEDEKILTNDWNEPIDNIDELVGSDSLNHFGEYENDSVFVRNDERKTDYEIILDWRKYSDVINDPPCPEDE